MDLATLAAILSHSSLRMVLKYVHVQQRHMHAEMDRLARENAAQGPIRAPHVRE